MLLLCPTTTICIIIIMKTLVNILNPQNLVNNLLYILLGHREMRETQRADFNVLSQVVVFVPAGEKYRLQRFENQAPSVSVMVGAVIVHVKIKVSKRVPFLVPAPAGRTSAKQEKSRNFNRFDIG